MSAEYPRTAVIKGHTIHVKAPINRYELLFSQINPLDLLALDNENLLDAADVDVGGFAEWVLWGDK